MKLWHAFSVFVFVLGTWAAWPVAAVEPPSNPAPPESSPPSLSDNHPPKPGANLDQASQAPLTLTLQSPVEAHIRAVLKQPTELEFANTPLPEVIAALKAKYQIEICLDTSALREQGIAPDTRITVNVKGVTLRSALRLLLRSCTLTFDVRDDVLLITTPEQEANHLLTCVYPVEDLALVREPSGELRADYAALMETIRNTIEPTSWEEVGGTGTIVPLENRMCLVVRQTEEVQEQIDQLLQTLRRIQVKGELLPARPHVKPSEPPHAFFDPMAKPGNSDKGEKTTPSQRDGK